jgi:hypothetical protein
MVRDQLGDSLSVAVQWGELELAERLLKFVREEDDLEYRQESAAGSASRR